MSEETQQIVVAEPIDAAKVEEAIVEARGLWTFCDRCGGRRVPCDYGHPAQYHSVRMDPRDRDLLVRVAEEWQELRGVADYCREVCIEACADERRRVYREYCAWAETPESFDESAGTFLRRICGVEDDDD